MRAEWANARDKSENVQKLRVSALLVRAGDGPNVAEVERLLPQPERLLGQSLQQAQPQGARLQGQGRRRRAVAGLA